MLPASEPSDTAPDWSGKPDDLALTVLSTLSRDFDEHGAAVLAQLREDDPKSYLTLLCRLVPAGAREPTGSLAVHTTIDLAVQDG